VPLRQQAIWVQSREVTLNTGDAMVSDMAGSSPTSSEAFGLKPLK
jgi:hypothetical protein